MYITKLRHMKNYSTELHHVYDHTVAFNLSDSKNITLQVTLLSERNSSLATFNWTRLTYFTTLRHIHNYHTALHHATIYHAPVNYIVIFNLSDSPKNTLHGEFVVRVTTKLINT